MNNLIHPDGAQVGAAIGRRFVVGAELGKGGQGIVFRGRRSETETGLSVDDDVAIKLLYDNSQDERTLREIALMEGVLHSNLAELLEHGTLVIPAMGGDMRYVVWRFIDGKSLHEVLATRRLSVPQGFSLARDIATAIAGFWSKKVVHRDIKPMNVMIRDSDHSAVLIDLGMARHLSQHTLTDVGAACGTLGYMSPEQARGEKTLTCASDVFALGITLYQAVTGRHPYSFRQQLVGTPVLPIAESVELNALVSQMLQGRIPFRPTPSRIIAFCEQQLPRPIT